jgi:periplasmic protein CpxP/Spy
MTAGTATRTMRSLFISFSGLLMKHLIKRTLLGLFGGALIIGSLFACSHRPGGTEGSAASPEMRTRMIDKVSSRLDLDAAQKQKLGVLADKLAAQRSALRGPGDSNPRAAMQALIAGGKLDQAGAKKLIDEKTAAVQTGSPEVIAAMADFFDNLRPEQQQKVREFMERGRRWGHRG